MISRKEIASLYGVHYQTVTKILRRIGLVTDEHGKGKRPLLTPIEFEMLKQKIGEPIKR